MRINYRTQGTCSRNIEIDVENGVIKQVHFDGGCHGNTQGISALVCGMEVKDIISRCKGIECGHKGTSCPDQLARALESMIETDTSK